MANAPVVELLNDTGSLRNNSQDGALKISGTEENAHIQYSTDGLTWTNRFVPGEGKNTVLVRQTDEAGNVSNSTEFSFVLDNSVIAPLVSLQNDSGIDEHDGITNRADLQLGSIEETAYVEYSLDGEHWDISQPEWTQGYNTVYARQVDGAGNISASTTLSFIFDTHISAPTVHLLEDTGTVSGVTQNGALDVASLEESALVEYSVDGQNWRQSFSPQQGENTVFVRQTDIAGNTSDSTTITFVLDNAVAAPSVSLSDDSGVDQTDNLTNNTGLQITGLEPDSIVQYSSNGNDWRSDKPAYQQGINTVYVRQVDGAGNTSASTTLTFHFDNKVNSLGVTSDNGDLTITGGENGAQIEYSSDGQTWSSQYELVEGSNTLHFRQTDMAGNTSDTSSLTFDVDRVAATPTISLLNDTNIVDLITRDGRIEVGNIENGASIQYRSDDSVWSSSFTPKEGENTVHVRQIDGKGNISNSASITFTLDNSVSAPEVQLLLRYRTKYRRHDNAEQCTGCNGY